MRCCGPAGVLEVGVALREHRYAASDRVYTLVDSSPGQGEFSDSVIGQPL